MPHLSDGNGSSKGVTMPRRHNNEKDSDRQTDQPAVRPILPQLLIGCMLWFSWISYGFAAGHTAVLLPRLQQNDSSLPTEELTGAWIASSFTGALPLGNLIGGAIADRLGRRFELRIAQVPYILGWILTACAWNHAILIVARILMGLASGMTALAIIILADEHPDARLRGMISGHSAAFYVFGIMTVTAVESLFEWRVLAGVGAAAPSIVLVVSRFLPETPFWLVRHGRIQEASTVLERVWGEQCKKQAKQELGTMVARCQRDTHLWKPRRCGMLASPHVMKPFLVSFVYIFLQIFSGSNLFVVYTVEIIAKCRRGSRDILDEFSAATVAGAVRLAICILIVWIMFIVGRRPLIISLAACTAVCCLALGTTLFLNSGGGFMSERAEGSLTLILIFAFVFASSGGSFLLPHILMGEMLPSRVRGFASGIVYASNDIATAGVVKAFPWISHTLLMHGMFWLFGAMSIVTALFAYLFIPETQGRSLDEIEEYFQGRNILWQRRDSCFKSRSVPIHETQVSMSLLKD